LWVKRTHELRESPKGGFDIRLARDLTAIDSRNSAVDDFKLLGGCDVIAAGELIVHVFLAHVRRLPNRPPLAML
jgi:hypothetical protein